MVSQQSIFISLQLSSENWLLTSYTRLLFTTDILHRFTYLFQPIFSCSSPTDFQSPLVSEPKIFYKKNSIRTYLNAPVHSKFQVQCNQFHSSNRSDNSDLKLHNLEKENTFCWEHIWHKFANLQWNYLSWNSQSKHRHLGLCVFIPFLIRTCIRHVYCNFAYIN
jgi:hypothetical protein